MAPAGPDNSKPAPSQPIHRALRIGLPRTHRGVDRTQQRQHVGAAWQPRRRHPAVPRRGAVQRATQPHIHRVLPSGHPVMPATRTPGRSGAGQRAGRSSPPGRRTSRTVRHHPGLAAQLQAPLEVGDGGTAWIALCGCGEESPLQPQGHFAAVAGRAKGAGGGVRRATTQDGLHHDGGRRPGGGQSIARQEHSLH